MAFVDYAKIELQAGHGGNGIVLLDRENFVPNVWSVRWKWWSWRKHCFSS